MKKESVIAGTILLSASSIFVRMIGFVFKIYISNEIGAEGMGVYSLIMSLYALSTTVATSGIALAVSKLAAEELGRGSPANARRVLRRAVGFSLVFGCAVGAVLMLLADPIGNLMLKDPRTVLSLRLLGPGMPFLAVSACFRGYFVAARQMFNPASGQVIEQLCKMTFIILLLGAYLPRGIEYACALVMLGITVGELICFLYTLAGYLRHKRISPPEGRANIRGVTASILKIIVPVSAGSYARSGLRLLEDIITLSALKVYMGKDDVATGAYGMLKGMVMPLLVFPLSLLSAFVITLTPEISRIGAQNDPDRLGRVISRVLQFTCIIGILIVGVFTEFSYELGVAVYHDGSVGEMLKLMAFLCPFMCVEMVVVSILQGIGEQVSSLRYNLLDCGLRIGLVAVLIPRMGVNGFLWMVVASNLFTSVLNLRRLLKVTKIPLQLGNWIIKPVLAVAAAGQCVRAMCNLVLFQSMPLISGLAVGLAALAAVYVLALFGVGSLSAEDFSWLWRRLKFSKKAPVQLTIDN